MFKAKKQSTSAEEKLKQSIQIHLPIVEYAKMHNGGSKRESMVLCIDRNKTNIPKYIFISGKKQHGKGTLGKYLRDLLSDLNHGVRPIATKNIDNIFFHNTTTKKIYVQFQREFYWLGALDIKNIDFADSIKTFGRALGLDKEQLFGATKEVFDARWSMTPRELMQKIGTNMRAIDRDIFAKACAYDMKKQSVPNAERKNLVTCINTDTRFPNEIECTSRILGYRNCCYIRIVRPNVAPTLFDNHESETSLDDHNSWHYIINNDGDEDDLKDKATKLLLQWIGFNNTYVPGSTL